MKNEQGINFMTCQLVIKKIKLANNYSFFIKQKYFDKKIIPETIHIRFDNSYYSDKTDSFLYYVSETDTTDHLSNVLLHTKNNYCDKANLYPTFLIFYAGTNYNRSVFIDSISLDTEYLYAQFITTASSLAEIGITRSDFVTRSNDFYCACCNKLRLTKDQLYELFHLSYKYELPAFEETLKQMSEMKFLDFTKMTS